MAKDKFKKLQQGGGAQSFQETLVQAASTVAAIERQQEQQEASPSEKHSDASAEKKNTLHPESIPDLPKTMEPPRFMRLPNPQIPMQEYSLVTRYCEQFANMTRQDFVELAIIEKLHSDGGMSDEDYTRRHEEIRNRPPRGQRKGMKSGSSSSSSSSE